MMMCLLLSQRFAIRLPLSAFVILLVMGMSLVGARNVSAQLRIVSWNTAGYDAARADTTRDNAIETVLAAIGNEDVNGIAKAPDIITLQEQDSPTTSTQDIVDILNGIHGPGFYARNTFKPSTTGGGVVGVIYNTNSLTLTGQFDVTSVSTDGPSRQPFRYDFRLNGYEGLDNQISIYVSHFKAGTSNSDEARRLVEAQAIRNNADLFLPNNRHIIYTGDLNNRDNREDFFNVLTSSGASQAIDPVNPSNAFQNYNNNAAFRRLHTQSPVTSARYGGQITGGMDDRFDYQLVTSELFDNEGLSVIRFDQSGHSVIESNYRAFGNTGTHPLNGEITSGFGAPTDILEALAEASDHLPVVVDYQVPAVMNVTVMSPTRAIVGGPVEAEVIVSNKADVVAHLGADELDFEVSADNQTDDDLSGSFTGQAFALQEGQTVRLAFNTNTAGMKTGLVNVRSDSQGVFNGQFQGTIRLDVLDSSNASFDRLSDVDTLQIDFGTLSQNTGHASQSFRIFNLPSASSEVLTARMDLDSFSASSQPFSTSLDTFGGLEADANGPTYTISVDTTEVGQFASTITLNFSDEDVPGERTHSLQLMVTASIAAIPEPNMLGLIGIGLAGLLFLFHRLRSSG